MFSINLNAICFDFARQSHIERFTPAIYAEVLYISNPYTMTIDIPLLAAPLPRRSLRRCPGRAPRL